GHSGRCDRDNRVYSNTCTLHLQCPGAYHSNDAGFSCSVVGLAEVATLTGWRTDGYDTAFDFIVFEVVKRGTDTGEGATKVNIDDLIEVVIGHFQQAAVTQNTSIVHQNIKATEFTHGCGDQFFGGFG